MQAKCIVFSKVPTETGKKILFALSDEPHGFPQFDLAKHSASALAKKNILARHETFDWHVNRSHQPRFFLFEKFVENENILKRNIHNLKNEIVICWMTFPQAIQKLTCGKEKNFLQLAVQYISSGGIDENVIVSDYDQSFLNSLKMHLDQKK